MFLPKLSSSRARPESRAELRSRRGQKAAGRRGGGRRLKSPRPNPWETVQTCVSLKRGRILRTLRSAKQARHKGASPVRPHRREALEGADAEPRKRGGGCEALGGGRVRVRCGQFPLGRPSSGDERWEQPRALRGPAVPRRRARNRGYGSAFCRVFLTAACVFPVSALCVGSDEWRAVSHLVSAARLGRTPCSRKSSRQSRESGTWSWPDSLLRARDLLGAQAPLCKMRERPHCTAAQSLPAGTPCMSATSPSQDRESEAACWCLPCRCASGLPLVVPAPPRPLCRDVSSRPGAGA